MSRIIIQASRHCFFREKSMSNTLVQEYTKHDTLKYKYLTFDETWSQGGSNTLNNQHDSLTHDTSESRKNTIDKPQLARDKTEPMQRNPTTELDRERLYYHQ